MNRRDKRIGIRLRKVLFLNGSERKPGSVVVLKPAAAAALVRLGVGRNINRSR